MSIRADVGRLERFAGKLRDGSDEISDLNRRLYSYVSAMVWEGQAFNRFNEEYQELKQSLNEIAGSMDSYASKLDTLAEKFRQEDLEEERRRREAAKAAQNN